MTLLQLHYLFEIYQCGSMNRAAQNLFVSQSRLSIAVGELEQELGIRIFERSNRGVVLTKEGRAFLDRAKPIIDQESRIHWFYGAGGPESFTVLNVSAQRFTFCTRAFAEFLNRQGAARFELAFLETDGGRVFRNVLEKRSDMGVLSLPERSRRTMSHLIEVSDLEFHKLRNVRPHIIVRKDHPLVAEQRLETHMLEKYPYLLFTEKGESAVSLFEEILPDFHHFQKVVYVDDRAAACDLIVKTDAFFVGGVSGNPESTRWEGNLCTLPLAMEQDAIQIGWIKRRDTPLNAEMRDFVELLDRVMGLDI